MMKNNDGFTILELTVSTAVLMLLAWMTFVALSSSITSAEVASSKGMAMGDVRDVLNAMTTELTEASKRTDDSLNPRLDPLRVVSNPAAGSPVEIIFQVPLDGSARNWSPPIRYRFVNEDTDRNGRLDNGEDRNNDRKLNRRVMRLQDVNGDGDFTDPGETRPVGAANDIRTVTFVMNGDLLTITVTASDLVGRSSEEEVVSTVRTSVYVLN